MRNLFSKALLVLAAMAAGVALAQTATRFAAIRVDGTSDLRGAITVTGTTSKLTVKQSTTSIAGLNLPHGSAPTSPADGDVWTTAGGLFVRVNGATVGPLITGTIPTQASGSFTATFDDCCTTDLTATVFWWQNGHVAQWYVQTTNGPLTSDSANFATTGNPIPSAIRPSLVTSTGLFGGFTDNGAVVLGCVKINGGNFQLGVLNSNSCNTGSWTASGTKNLPTLITFSTWIP